MKRLAWIFGVALVAWLAVFAIGRSAALQAAKDTIAAQKVENAAIVESAYRQSRVFEDSLRTTTQRLARLQQRDRANAVRVAEHTGTTIDSLRTVPVTDTTALPTALAAYDALSAAFRDYLRSDSLYHKAEAEERAGLYHSLTLADSTILHKNTAIVALQKSSGCTIMWQVKCPTRTQAFVFGVIATGAVVIALR